MQNHRKKRYWGITTNHPVWRSSDFPQTAEEPNIFVYALLLPLKHQKNTRVRAERKVPVVA